MYGEPQVNTYNSLVKPAWSIFFYIIHPCTILFYLRENNKGKGRKKRRKNLHSSCITWDTRDVRCPPQHKKPRLVLCSTRSFRSFPFQFEPGTTNNKPLSFFSFLNRSCWLVIVACERDTSYLYSFKCSMSALSIRNPDYSLAIAL